MSKHIVVFVVRWLFNSLGLWISVKLFGTGYEIGDVTGDLTVFLLAGFIFSVVNSVLRPFFVIISIPMILLTLGLFVIVVNGLMVYISLKIAPDITMTFFNSILTGIILSLVNYIVSATLVLKTNGAR